MTIGSGLGATFGLGLETTVGTFQAPSEFVTVQSAALSLKKTVVQSKVLHGGLYNLAARRAYTTRTADGQVKLDLYDRSIGNLLKACLGAGSVTANTGYSTMVFTPADLQGLSYSLQVGKPSTDGTMHAFSYPGAKVTEWEIAVQVGQQASFDVTFDAWDELTAQTYAAPSYTNGNMLTFAEGTVWLGGTVSTVSGVSSITGGSKVATCKSATVQGKNALDVSRFFLGANGLKAEQLANDTREITGNLDIEFANLTDVYDTFNNNGLETGVALELKFVGPVITGTTTSEIDILIPRIYFDENPIEVDGPKILEQKAKFTGLDDGTNNQIQITYVTADTAL